MGKIGISDRLNANNKKNIIFKRTIERYARPTYIDSVRT